MSWHRAAALLIATASIPTVAIASVSNETHVQKSPAAVARASTRYVQALEGVRNRHREDAIQRLLAAARDLKHVLLARAGNQAVIEVLEIDEFQTVERRATGMIINREEVLIVESDARYYLELARRYGNRADIAFFEAYFATYSDTVWPSYVWQETDVTGCTAFSSGELVSRYRAWQSFRSKYPEAYAAEVRDHLEEIEWHIADSTCACDDAPAVAAELRRFVENFPDSPVRERVNRRLRDLLAHKTDITFNCAPG